MRTPAICFSLLLLFCLAAPGFAQDAGKPEHAVGKMAYKLTSGITNIATSVAELPKQSYLTVRDQGAVGYVIGPLKGLGMTVYRAFIGTVETAFFMVPQPGYYDPAIDPDFVWNGWGKQQTEHEVGGEIEVPESMSGKIGE